MEHESENRLRKLPFSCIIKRKGFSVMKSGINKIDISGRNMTMCEVLDQVENRGIQKGIIQGEDTILSLMNYLLSNNRTGDAKKATEDKAYRNKLLTEIFGEKREV